MLEKDARSRYRLELFAGIGIYAVLLVVALRFGPSMPNEVLRTALMVSPMLGFGLAMWAVVRDFGRMDEYVLLRSLQALGISAGITAGLTFTYGFLENVGYPKLSMFVVWPLLGTAWFGINVIRKLLDR